MFWYENRPIAHRGLHDNVAVPENSLLAFKMAVEEKIPFEFDVHLSSDGKLVVLHDHNLKRLTGIDAEVESSTATFITSQKLMGTDENIPYLDDVLMLVNGSVPLLIEIKNEGKVGALEEKLLAVLKEYKGEFAIQSFNPFALSYVAKNAPKIKRGQLSGSFRGENLPFYVKFILSNMFLNILSKPHFIAYEMTHLNRLSVKLHRFFKIPILAWTLEKKEDVLGVVKYSDNIIFKFFRP